MAVDCFGRPGGFPPPRTNEIQHDEKWAFVYKKQKHCDSQRVADRHCGDNWDQTAFDPEHRLVLEVVPGKRTRRRVRKVVQAAKRRIGGRIMSRRAGRRA